MKRLYILTALILTGMTVTAQSANEVLLFSRQAPFGTARSAAMGGAFGALGGDLSSLNTNPAGIGVFRKSEVSFTPSLTFSNTESGSRDANKNSFQAGNAGFVVSLYSPSFDWKSFNFGVTYTNMNNFNRKTNQFVGNSANSMTDAFAAMSQGISPDQLDVFSTALAYESFLTYANDLNQYSSVLVTDGTLERVNQYKTINEDGYQGEYAFSFGTNYKDKLYLGMTVGLQSAYYKLHSRYTEIAEENAPSLLDFYDFDEYRKISGVGVNLKFGAIYRPIPELRIGAAIHTPTWYNMDYTAENLMYSQFTTETDPSIGREYQSYDYTSGSYSYSYNMKTPWRAILSVATVLKQKAIISLDYEYTDNTSAKLNTDDAYSSYDGVNSDIKSLFRTSHSLRAGAEYRFNSIFSLRAGYAYWNSPYKYAKEADKINTITAGFGLNFGQFYCDAAYIHKTSKNETVFYAVDYATETSYESIVSAPVKNKYISNEARITLGVRF